MRSLNSNFIISFIIARFWKLCLAHQEGLGIASPIFVYSSLTISDDLTTCRDCIATPVTLASQFMVLYQLLGMNNWQFSKK